MKADASCLDKRRDFKTHWGTGLSGTLRCVLLDADILQADTQVEDTP
jgi:hypothetical protein